MDDAPLRYSAHARKRMVTREITEDDVEGIIAYPIRRSVTHHKVIHTGYSGDGRLLAVVTDRTETFVFSVVDKERRRRKRRYRK
jgi:hypothetical protein